jgi:hypothetical protein
VGKAIISLKRQGDLELLLRCIEDEFDPKRAAAETPESGIYHYQLIATVTPSEALKHILRVHPVA